MKKKLRHPRKDKARTGPPNIVGSDDKMPLIIARAWELKAGGYEQLESCEMLAKEFKMPRVPSRQTLHSWLAKGREHLENHQDILKDAMFVCLEQLRRLTRKWLPIAEAGSLKVQRKRMKDGEIAYEVQEEEIKEQAVATKLVHDGIKLTASILGIGRGEKDAGGSSESLQMTLIRNFNQIVMTREQAEHSTRDVVLLLEGGDPALEAIEGRGGDE